MKADLSSIGSTPRHLGHGDGDRTTAEIYLHSSGEAEREALAGFERVSRMRVVAKVSHSKN